MNRGKNFFVYLLFLILSFTKVKSQEKRTTVGLVFKNTIPSSTFRTKTPVQLYQNNTSLLLHQKYSFSYGMILRKSLSKVWSVESGIFSIKRSYSLQLLNINSAESVYSDFSITSFEIPVLALLYVKLSDQIYIDAASGVTLNFFPSQVGSKSDYIDHLSVKNGWIKPSSLTSIGMEYRTKKSGYFYVGSSFHFYFFPIYGTKVTYLTSVPKEEFTYDLLGNYLSIDLKYFFYEDKKSVKGTK